MERGAPARLGVGSSPRTLQVREGAEELQAQRRVGSSARRDSLAGSIVHGKFCSSTFCFTELARAQAASPLPDGARPSHTGAPSVPIPSSSISSSFPSASSVRLDSRSLRHVTVTEHKDFC